MFNTYTITLSLFVIAGIIVTSWSWRNILTARKTLLWPTVKGAIEKSSPGSMAFSYVINEQSYHYSKEVSVDLTPGQNTIENHVNKYPPGKQVTVYYQPENPENATLNPELNKDDWFIFLIGLGTTLTGFLFLFL